MRPLDKKIIWILSLILCLVVATNFFIVKEKEKTKRIKIEADLITIIDSKKVVEDRLTNELKEKEILQKELTEEKKWSNILEKQLEELGKEIKLTLDRLEQKEEEISTLRTGLEEERSQKVKLEKDLYKLETKVTVLSRKDRRFERKFESLESQVPVELEKIVISSNPVNVGKVLVVNKEYDFIVIGLEKSGSVKKGDILSIFREDEFIARVKVERINENMTTAIILAQYKNEQIKESDLVKF